MTISRGEPLLQRGFLKELFQMLKKDYDRINSIKSLVERLSIENSNTKVAGMLLSLVKEFGEEMGSLAGIARETVIWEMKEFQREGILEDRGNRKILIKSIEGLEDTL